jgi:calcineurin-like phosphoesterase family protein
MATFFTSDTHFSHSNIILYCDRPFLKLDGQPDPDAMNRELFRGWNSVVGPEDTVYHLGDFAMSNWRNWKSFRAKLNGKIVLVRGNHDRKLDTWMLPQDKWVECMMLPDGTFLTHVPPDYRDQERYGHDKPITHPVPPEATRVFCGHVHDRWGYTEAVIDGRVVPCYNVGVDIRGYVPQTMEQILATPGGRLDA